MFSPHNSQHRVLESILRGRGQEKLNVRAVFASAPGKIKQIPVGA
jgi:hypothetical protein